MATKKKLLQAAAGSAGGEALNVEDVFSNYLYTGDGTGQTITNGIDLAGEGGLVWAKSRSSIRNNILSDTERGTGQVLFSNNTNANDVDSTTITSYNSDGFTMGSSTLKMNTSGEDFVSWTFRKAPKFFDVVTWTGDGTAGRTLSHSLNSSVGAIIVKRTDGLDEWKVLHRNDGSQWRTGVLNSNTSLDNATANLFGNGSSFVAPTSTEFTVTGNLNGNTDTFVAYLFAHNDGDGEFGPDGDQDIIKCDVVTVDQNSGSDTVVNLGFEPQWIIIKNNPSGYGWFMFDTMRGWTNLSSDNYLIANDADAESSAAGNGQGWLQPTSTGFTILDGMFGSGDWAYIAIRRGPMAVPESATDVFAIDTGDNSSGPEFTSGFPVDFAITKNKSTSSNFNASARLTGATFLKTNAVDAESAGSSQKFDYQDGYLDNTLGSDNIAWMWKRAPSFFDVSPYVGDYSNGFAVRHNLGVAPEMAIFKHRDNASCDWYVYHKDLGHLKYLNLNTTGAAATHTGNYFYSAPDASSFYLGAASCIQYFTIKSIAYFFGSVDGVSKVGSYTGNGSSQTIDCGFSSGARFVLIKRTDSTSDWWVFDTERGIVSGNDSLMAFNGNAAESTSYDNIDPDSSGFIINNTAWNENASGGNYIFYAIA